MQHDESQHVMRVSLKCRPFWTKGSYLPLKWVANRTIELQEDNILHPIAYLTIGHFTPISAGLSLYVRFWRIKTVPALKELKYL